KPNAIIEANQFVLGDMPFTPKPEGVHITEKSEVSSRVILGKDTQVIDSVIRGPVILGDNVVIKNSYIGPYTSIGDNVTVENSEIEASIIMQVDSSLIADNSVVTSANHIIPSTHRFILAENSYVQL
ncbi:MAG: glucose-1-phosphate thymidylyltransferase, partial [Anaerolineae bacterium]|nr:glucose-1-phosphate thymidylyltransferase [Anaerolineae bacterium]